MSQNPFTAAILFTSSLGNTIVLMLCFSQYKLNNTSRTGRFDVSAMMNGRAVRSVLIRNNRQENGSVDHVPRTIQFDESSEEYRCLCNCFHVKTGGYIIGFVHVVLIFFFLVQSLLVYLQHDGRLQEARGVKENYVFASFVIAMVTLGIATLALLFLFLGITRNIAPLLIPHLVVQCLVLLILLVVLICGTIAICTDTAFFYRVLNAAPFMEHPRQSTVALDAGTMARIYFLMIIYALTFIFEIWFIYVIYCCYCYLEERSTYMKYCLAFSTPMKTLSAR